MEPEKTEELNVAKKEGGLKAVAHFNYLAFIFIITSPIGLIVGYFRRSKAKGTWLESHFRWQARTFWLGFLFAFLGLILFFVGMATTIMVSLVAAIVFATNIAWVWYRVIKGWMLLCRNEPVVKKKEV